VRRIGEDEVEDCFARVTATCALGFAHIARRIARIRSGSWNQFRRQTIGLLEHANGIVGAIDVLAIRCSIVVVIDAVVADFGLRHAVWREETRRIGTIDFIVAIVVDAVITNLGRAILTSRGDEARRIGTIDEFVAIFVLSSHTHFGFAGGNTSAREFPSAIGVGAIDEQIAIVVGFVIAKFESVLAGARLRGDAIGIAAIDDAIAIVVESVVASRGFIRQTAARGSSLTIGIETIDDAIAIVVRAIATIFARRRRHAAAIRNLFARRIAAIGYAITIVVGAVGTAFRIAWKNLRVRIVAIASTA
jgi:hypothetical protein